MKKAQYIQEVLFNPQSYDYNFFRKLCSNIELLEDKCVEYERVRNVIKDLSYINNATSRNLTENVNNSHNYYKNIMSLNQ